MEGNPFVELINHFKKTIQDSQPVYYRFGTVISKEPLRIETSGTIQEKSDLLRNDTVVDLDIGDNVLLLPIEDQQRFIIICKVVSV